MYYYFLFRRGWGFLVVLFVCLFEGFPVHGFLLSTQGVTENIDVFSCEGQLQVSLPKLNAKTANKRSAQ